jgi:hypothetical protein
MNTETVNQVPTKIVSGYARRPECSQRSANGNSIGSRWGITCSAEACSSALPMMLLTISPYATWHGMRDFIMGVSGEPPEVGKSFMPTDLLMIRWLWHSLSLCG